jgi:hypothetical protein
MNCPSCGADRVSAAGCPVCGAAPVAGASRTSSRSPPAASDRVDGIPGHDWRAGADPAVARATGYVGVARAVRLRTEPSSSKGPTWQVLNFRLDRFSDDGRPLPSIPVEMRRLHLHGSVNEGETVEVPGAWRPGQLLEVKRIQNISTGSPVIAKGKPHLALKILAAFLLLALLITIMALIIAGVFRKASSINQGTGTPMTVADPVVRTTAARPPARSCVTPARDGRPRPAPDRAAKSAAICLPLHGSLDAFLSEVPGE